MLHVAEDVRRGHPKNWPIGNIFNPPVLRYDEDDGNRWVLGGIGCLSGVDEEALDMMMSVPEYGFVGRDNTDVMYYRAEKDAVGQ